MITNTIITIYHNSGLQYATSYTEMPTASEQNLGQIAKYIGETTFSYTKDHYYQCVKSGTISPTYSWEQADEIGNLLPIEVWNRYNYEAWCFGGHGAGINQGYDNANDFNSRIPYKKNENLSVSNFAVGDIVIPQEVDIDITDESQISQYDRFNITSINDNNFGTRPHIHIGGR